MVGLLVSYLQVRRMRALKCCRGVRGPCSKVSFPLVCCRSWSDITENPSLPMSQTLVYQHLEQKQWGQMFLVGRQPRGSDYNTCQHKWAIIWDGDLQMERTLQVVISNWLCFPSITTCSFLLPFSHFCQWNLFPSFKAQVEWFNPGSLLPFSQLWSCNILCLFLTSYPFFLQWYLSPHIISSNNQQG